MKHYELILQLWKNYIKIINIQSMLDFSIQICSRSPLNYELITYSHSNIRKVGHMWHQKLVFTQFTRHDQQHNHKKIDHDPTRFKTQNTTSTSHNLSSCWIWLLIKNPLFMSPTTHMINWNYKGGKRLAFIYVETIAYRCKEVRRKRARVYLCWNHSLQLQRSEKGKIPCLLVLKP